MSLKINEIEKARKIIDDIICDLSLNLENLSVLTEVGSDYYQFTPLIASMAGARQVFAWTKDSIYGKGEDNVRICEEIAELYGIDATIEFAVNTRPNSHVKAADIITNSGFTRPLDENLLKYARRGEAVISLMYEAWEFRTTDVDLNYCNENQIKIAGVWENHPDLLIFNACGQLAIKMAYEAGYEVIGNNIIVWSDDQFGETIENAFLARGAKNVVTTTSEHTLIQNIDNADFIFLCDYDECRVLLGNNGVIDLKNIIKQDKSVGIIHLFGKVDPSFLEKIEIPVYPNKAGQTSIMSFTLAHLGMDPVLRLQAAGLKVGECLFNGIEHSVVNKTGLG